jgi:peptidoglycan/LPS O-acetylase OafA/YrhL
MGKDGYKPGLDGLRGIAALSVAIFHTILGIDGSQVDRILYKPFLQLTGAYDQATWIVLKTFNGETAVAIFFILSGTVLFDSLRRSPETPWLLFLVRRALRIYPALITCLILSVAIFWLAAMPVGLRDVAENAALVSFRVNGASWTLAVEMIAAFLIPVAFLGFRMGREWGLLLTGIAITLLLNAPWLPSFAIKNFWLYFLIGMLIPTRAGQWIASRCPGYVWPVLLFILLFAAGPTTQKICGSLLVALIYYDRAGALGRALQLKPSLFLGRISYSFYLFNVAFVEVICASLRQYPVLVARPLEVGATAAVVVVLATLPVAWFSLIWIERPFIRLGRAEKPKSRSTAPAE